ncbi:acyl-CoA reductase-like NAD-dependent aldehyde dehydrogenase [Microbacterium marinum]|uniref:Acyl-CoA reductase-like NAD-dependent aldehyde dehydrogenase n=1 Tax=Microbacterium marinum TaxID=421115 RepID=A0A7W7FJL1_9MICO|nr:aldehyde dehydrogenase family protein [Microbacterium marinum]MBB4665349.1 acyl-CoA reductase-like NAD-dependent aldehyde dehydrogenase [Microbacterium marinum]
MTTTSPATASSSEDSRAALDAAIARLRVGADAWASKTLTERRALLLKVRAAVGVVAADWANIAAAGKGLSAGHPLRGEEWLAGPYAALVALDAYADTLKSLIEGRSPIDRVRTGTAPGGRTVVHTSPLNPIDALLLSGYTTEVWLRPGVSARQARDAAGLAARHPSINGGVGLVLGAGNVTSIPFLDVLYELIAFGRVALLKVNPTQDALVPVFTRALAPLVTVGAVQIVRGGGEVGAYLTRHPDIDHIHITGSEATFRAIVGGGKDRLAVPITAELGGVSPIIVVPGRWSRADLRFQAEHIATMRLQNSGHNCIAGQVVLLSRDWPQREEFERELRRAYARAPRRPVWYPHSDARLAAVREAYPDAEWSSGDTRAIVTGGGDVETTEYFAPVLGILPLGGDAEGFLDAAVEHANNRLTGTLGANILVDPETQHRLGPRFEEAVARLRYGTVAVNSWTAFGFLTPTATWGAYPGGTVDDAPSGLGIVHNALLLDDVERTVVRGPFRPFPRSLGRSRFSVLPKPPWFVTARTGAAVSEGFARFRIDRHWGRLAVTLVRAFGA